MRVAVVGAGVSGLTAAYRLQQAGWTVQVFESDSEVGGRVKTIERAGYLIDTGASALAASYASYNNLAGELGIRSEIVPAAPGIGIYRDGRVHILRTDRLIRSGLTTKLLSTRSKLKAVRMALDIAAARSRGQLDYADMRRAAPIDTEDARSYALRVLNAELDQYLCEPVVRTMLIADTNKVSKVELFSGFANIMSTSITTLRGGQGRLPRMLASRLDVTLDAPVTRVSDLGDGVEIEVLGGRRRYDAVVIAAPLPVAARICPDRAGVLAPLAGELGYTQAITVGVATRRPPDCEAMLVQLPSREDPDIALMFLDHNKCPDRVPKGRGLIGVDWETDASTKWMDEPDEAIAEHTVNAVLRVFPELHGSVEFIHVTRWRHALPFTKIGAYRLIGEFNASLDPADRIQFAADYMSAAGQNTAVEFGTKAARNLIRQEQVAASR